MTDRVYDQREDVYAAQQADVRIVKLGSRPEDKLYRATCSTRRAEVEFKRSSARFYDDLRYVRIGGFLVGTFPLCRITITVRD